MNVHPIEKKSAALNNHLQTVLSDTFILYLKTLNYHWNVTGQGFYTLHAMFEEQYTALAGALDEIAERIRQLNEYANGTTASILKNATIKENESIRKSNEMLKDLIEGHTQLAKHCKQGIEISNGLNDEATVDLLTQRLAYHEKSLWMLKSSLGE